MYVPISRSHRFRRIVRYGIVLILALLVFKFRNVLVPSTSSHPSRAPHSTTSTRSGSEPPKERSASSSEVIILGPENAVQTNAVVTHVVDGDTIDVLFDGEEKKTRIRLLGVNTPETVDPRRPVQCFGKNASNFTKSTLSGKRIRLEADSQADERDKYGRLLRNILLADGTDFNALLVREGYAHAYVSFPLNPLRKRELKQLEKDAKAAGRGLWAKDACGS